MRLTIILLLFTITCQAQVNITAKSLTIVNSDSTHAMVDGNIYKGSDGLLRVRFGGSAYKIPLTASNGLIKIGASFMLGGVLTGNTVVGDNGGGWFLDFGLNGTRLGAFRGWASAINFDGTNTANFQVGNQSLSLNTTSATLTGGNIVFESMNDLTFRTNTVDRLIIDSDGSFDLAGTTPGTSGQVFTSNGAGSPPTWQASSAITGTGSADRIAYWTSTSALSFGPFWDNTSGNERLGIGASPSGGSGADLYVAQGTATARINSTGSNTPVSFILERTGTGSASWSFGMNSSDTDLVIGFMNQTTTGLTSFSSSELTATARLQTRGLNNGDAFIAEDDAGNDIIRAGESGGVTELILTPSSVFEVSSQNILIASSNATVVDGELQLSLTSDNGSVVLTAHPTTGDIYITNIPDLDNSTTQILGRDATGKIEYRDASTLAGSPGGSNLQFQYNNAGVFGGSSNFVWTSVANAQIALSGSVGALTITSNAASNAIYSGSGISQTLGSNLTITSNGGSAELQNGAATIRVTSGNNIELITPTGAGDSITLATDSGGTTINLNNGGDFTLGTSSGTEIFFNVQRTTCAGAPSGAVYNNAGILSICP